MATKPPTTTLFTVADIARMASVCEKTVRNEIDRGKLGHVRVATALRITSTQYEDWIRRGTVKPTL